MLSQSLWTRHSQRLQRNRSVYHVHFQEVIRNNKCSSRKESKGHGHQFNHHSTSCKSTQALSVLWVYLWTVLCLFYLGCQLFEAVTSSSSSGTRGCAAYSTAGPPSHVITWFGLIFAWDTKKAEYSCQWFHFKYTLEVCSIRYTTTFP